MNIAILGAGNVGGALGAALAGAGHQVTFGVRDPDSEKCRNALALAPGARALPAADAVRDADVILFALRWDAVPATVAQLPSLEGHIVIDAMNRVTLETTRSTAEDLAQLLPGAKVAKAFNTTGFENMTTARRRRHRAAMFVAADDADAKRVALELAGQIGFEPYDAGGLDNAKPLEEMVRVWLALARQKGRGIAFAVSED
jgi:8-hydroxy-5-deazaflavin:NADPH oxidoreductase